jgi:hypothetical protein
VQELVVVVNFCASLLFYNTHPLNLATSLEEQYQTLGWDSDPNIKSDILVVLPYPAIREKLQHLQFTFSDPAVIDRFHWSVKGVQDPSFSIIAFPGEFKEADATRNENQLIMALTTAQSQRQALSLEKSIVMGATGYRRSVTIYSSYWNDDSTVKLHSYFSSQELLSSFFSGYSNLQA